MTAHAHPRTSRQALGLALALAAVSAAGCATRYGGPELAVPGRYGAHTEEEDGLVGRMRPPRAGDIVEASADRWWLGFDDPGLDRFVSDVLARSRRIEIAALRLERAGLRTGLARNDRLPAAAGSLSDSDSEPMRDSGRRTGNASAQLSVGYEVDLWGRLRSAENAAAWAERASAEDARSIALSLAADACDLYWRLGDLNGRIAQGERGIDHARRIRSLIEAQYRAGAVSGLEAGEAEQNLQRQLVAQSRLLQQRSELRQDIAALRDGLAWPEADEPRNAQAAPLPLDPGLPTDLLARRPDLRATEARLRQTLADADVARRSLYPQLNLTLGASGSGEGLGDLVDHPVRTLTRSLLLPFLDVNGTRLRIAAARKDYDIAEAEFYRSLVEALADVESALAARAHLQRQLQSARATLAAAEAVESRYAARYRAGAAPLRLWLEAQQSRISAEGALSQAELEMRRNDVFLAKALGGSGRAPQSLASASKPGRGSGFLSPGIRPAP